MAAQPRAEEPEQQPGKRSMGLIAGVSIALLLICVAAGFFLLRPREAFGQVSELSWSRSIGIEQLAPVQHETWRPELPAGAIVQSCEARFHHEQDEPADGAEKVCGTPYTVDKGNGYAEVVQDCQYRIYVDWCRHTVKEWTEVDRAELTGRDSAPRWPALTLGSGQREGERQEEYIVAFQGDGQDYTLTTADPAEYARFQVGTRWQLQVVGSTVISAEPG